MSSIPVSNKIPTFCFGLLGALLLCIAGYFIWPGSGELVIYRSLFLIGGLICLVLYIVIGSYLSFLSKKWIITFFTGIISLMLTFSVVGMSYGFYLDVTNGPTSITLTNCKVSKDTKTRRDSDGNHRTRTYYYIIGIKENGSQIKIRISKTEYNELKHSFTNEDEWAVTYTYYPNMNMPVEYIPYLIE